MTFSVRPFAPDDTQAWEEFCTHALQSTFLHTRAFLSYHGDRFVDRSVLIEDQGRIVGALPAAQHLDDDTCVVSHPGITYGGVLHQGHLVGSRMIEALRDICNCFSNLGYRRILYKAMPAIYHRAPAQDDLYALFRLGASRVRCDLSSSILLSSRLAVGSRRKRGVKKAIKAGIRVQSGVGLLASFWPVVIENLERKHQSVPVHSLAELELLCERFPENIECNCALLDDQVVAGVLLFKSSIVTHAQYIASSLTGHEYAALDALFEHCITEATHAGVRWFDFGISNERDGAYLNDGLYGFKTEFGGGGIVHEFYEMQI